MYPKAISTMLLVLFAFLLVSVNALPRVLHAKVTPTPTTPRASSSLHPSSQMMSSMASITHVAHPTRHASPHAPKAGFEEGNATESTSTATSTTTSAASAPTNTAESLASAIDLMSSLSGFFSSLKGLLGTA